MAIWGILRHQKNRIKVFNSILWNFLPQKGVVFRHIRLTCITWQNWYVTIFPYNLFTIQFFWRPCSQLEVCILSFFAWIWPAGNQSINDFSVNKYSWQNIFKAYSYRCLWAETVRRNDSSQTFRRVEKSSILWKWFMFIKICHHFTIFQVCFGFVRQFYFPLIKILIFLRGVTHPRDLNPNFTEISFF